MSTGKAKDGDWLSSLTTNHNNSFYLLSALLASLKHLNMSVFLDPYKAAREG